MTKITYFCFLYVPRPLPSSSLKWNHNDALPWSAGPGGRRVSLELCPFLASCVMGSTENRAASTHSCSVEHNLTPKSLKGFGHLSVMLKGKKNPKHFKKFPKPLACHSSGYLQNLCFVNTHKRLVKWHYSIPKMTQHNQLSELLLTLKNFSQISMARHHGHWEIIQNYANAQISQN